MEIVYQKYAGLSTPRGEVAGYNSSHIILAKETSKTEDGFRKINKDVFIAEAYQDKKYRYAYIDESELSKIYNVKPNVT